MTKLSGILLTILINLLLISFLLVIVDLFMGVPKYLEKRHILLKDFGENIDINKTPAEGYLKNCDNLESKSYRIRTNEDGFIIGENDIKNTKDSVDIIFFGGSTTECEFVDENKRYPYLVQETLSRQIGKKVEILNGGHSGNNTLHSTLNLLSKGIPQNPKVVVLMHNINDLGGLEKTGSYYKQPASRNPIQRHRFHSSPFKARISGLRDVLVPNLSAALYPWYSNILKTSTTDEWEGFRNTDTIPFTHIQAEFEKATRTFINIAKSHNIEVVLMTQFNRLNLNDKFIVESTFKNKNDFVVFSKRYHQLNETIRKIAETEQVSVIDLAELVPSNNQYLYDPVHLTTKGSEYVAEIITQYFSKHYGEKFKA